MEKWAEQAEMSLMPFENTQEWQKHQCNHLQCKIQPNGFQIYSAVRFKEKKKKKNEAENFVFATTARAVRLKESCSYEATSALKRYYISLQADA